MKNESPEHARRQVTVQPQEKPSKTGQPDVPHRTIKQPGQPPPDSESERSTQSADEPRSN